MGPATPPTPPSDEVNQTFWRLCELHDPRALRSNAAEVRHQLADREGPQLVQKNSTREALLHLVEQQNSGGAQQDREVERALVVRPLQLVEQAWRLLNFVQDGRPYGGAPPFRRHGRETRPFPWRV